MRVALHLGNLRGQGSSQVGRGILGGLLAAGTEVAQLWVPRQWEGGVEARRVTQVPPGALVKPWVDNVLVRRELSRCSAQTLFSVGDTGLPLPGVPHLLMVQQAFLAYPTEALDFPMPVAFRAKMRLLSAYFRAGLPGVSHFTVQTQDMKARLIRRWNIDPQRVSVIPSAVAAELSTIPRARGASEVAPHLCYLASPGPHKNFAVLPGMMAALKRDFPRLRCSLTVRSDQVPEVAALAERLGVLDRFVFHGAIERRQALRLLASAELAIIPSKLESFGLPYYEALSFGVPVVASDRAFAREACGQAARYAAADDAAGFADHVAAALSSEAEHERMSAASAERFQQIHVGWPEIGRLYSNVLHGLCDGGVRAGPHPAAHSNEA